MMIITVPRFHFRTLVLSHGWAFLPPFSWDDHQQTLLYEFRLLSGNAVKTKIQVRNAVGAKSVVQLSWNRNLVLTPKDRKVMRGQVRRMLRLDEDFREFWQLCKQEPELGFVTRRRCGGILRAPTAFEDLVKTVCTANCAWRNTIKMCESLCCLDGNGFPTPEVILKLSPRQLARRIPCGYRSTTIHSVARLAASGVLPLDQWAAVGAYEKIRNHLAAIRGIGPYCTNHMLTLLGHYEAIPVDTAVLKYLRQVHFGGEAVTEDKAVSPYIRYGAYRFLAYKFGRIAEQLDHFHLKD